MSIRAVKKYGDSAVKTTAPRYARIPKEVLHDKRLSFSARLVYAELALWVFQGTVASVGVRKIGERLGMAEKTVRMSLSELEAAGLIKRCTGKKGERGVYHLESAVFGQKQGKKTEVVRGASGGPRFASVAVEDVA